MAELKTRRTRASVKTFIDGVENERRRADARDVLALMKKVTGERPSMWGDSIVGFGSYRYAYESGRKGEWFVTGFSPRKSSLTIYVMSGFAGLEALLGKLGKHRTSRGCLYVNRLEDIDLRVLERLLKASIASLRKAERAQTRDERR